MGIYTKKGDKGETGLYSGLRVSKYSLKIEAIGLIDEVNSYLGVICSEARGGLKTELYEVQKSLFTIGSILAGSKLKLSANKTKKLEEEIDKIENTLPVLENFILPGGRQIAAQLHYARTLVRKAERLVVGLSKEEEVGREIVAYLNRLSDYLFILARRENKIEGYKEEVWKP
jgi:cob(I)alamin adenosyltransferase